MGWEMCGDAHGASKEVCESGSIPPPSVTAIIKMTTLGLARALR